eukprot:XP_011618458.1 PREDICTED: high choriolytic enzyme 1-like [Takifugu rubripes]
MLVFSWALLTLSLVLCAKAEEEVGVKDETSRELSVGELLERANRDRSPGVDEPPLAEGDIAVRTDNKNADPCTSRGCLWNKWTDGKVYIPYYIANHYSSRERDIIVRGLESFSGVSCIRFRPYQNGDYEWLSIESGDGSVFSALPPIMTSPLGTAQQHNVSVPSADMKYNFNKIATLNQGTSYDYGSVMQYHRYAFSKNGLPTMVPIPNNNVSFGEATQMSRNDIDRLNRLYKC